MQPVVNTLRKNLFDQLVAQTASLSLNHQCRIHNIILFTLHKSTMHSNNIFVNATTMIAIVFAVKAKLWGTEVLRRLAPNSRPPTSSLLKATGATVADDEDDEESLVHNKECN